MAGKWSWAAARSCQGRSSNLRAAQRPAASSRRGCPGVHFCGACFGFQLPVASTTHLGSSSPGGSRSCCRRQQGRRAAGQQGRGAGGGGGGWGGGGGGGGGGGAAIASQGRPGSHRSQSVRQAVDHRRQLRRVPAAGPPPPPCIPAPLHRIAPRRTPHLRQSLVLVAKRPLGVSMTMEGGLKGYWGGKVTLPAGRGAGRQADRQQNY